MNRLILIGNGFDLAHNLKTSYKDFIEYLWKGIFEEINLDKRFRFTDTNKLIEIEVGSNDKTVEFKINEYLEYYNLPRLQNVVSNLTTENIKNVISTIKRIGMSYSNYFFKIISLNYINKNWSDIEADYYRVLLRVKDKQAEIYELNKQFKQIKELLREYLKSLPKPNKIDKLGSIIYEPIKVDEISLLNLNNFKQEVQDRVKLFFSEKKSNRVNTLRKLRAYDFKLEELTKGIEEGFDLDNEIAAKHLTSFLLQKKDKIDSKITDLFLTNNILLLNFNYTKTEEMYIDNPPRNNVLDENVNIQANHIHGSLDDPSNHMIFGYGDEEADEYKELEKLDYKGLLDNVKSINYLEASNYRDMERFIESAPYQIFVMGMSCGMADRTMLRKLFQHKNCVSVKPFYFQRKDGKGNIAGDNYTEIVQNISRCFSDKDLLRSVVVNKPNCEPLPQHDDK